MRIAMFADCYHPVVNGVVTSVAILARALRKQGHRVLLFVPSEPGYRESDREVYRFASLRFAFQPEERFALPWPPAYFCALKSARIQVVHLHTPFNLGLYGWLASEILGIPRVFTHHTLWEEYVHYLPLPREPLRRLAVALCRAFANSSRAVVTPSAEVRERLWRQGVYRPVYVVPTGIEAADFQGGDPEMAREELGLGPQDRLFLYVGRMGREKSLEFLLEAFADACREGLSVYLALIGDGPERPRLEQLCISRGLAPRVRFLGYRERSRLRHYLAAARGFLFASRTETQGLVLLEAQAAGVPVLAVRAQGTNEAVDPGRTGLIVEPGDREGFARGIRRLAQDDDLHARLTRAAGPWAERFSAAAMARHMVRIYRRAGAAP